MEYLKKENDIASSDILSATAISGIRSAFLDIFSKRMEISLVEYLSNSLRDSNKHNDKVELYANINRSLLPNDNGPVDRSPESFSKRALEILESWEMNITRFIKVIPTDYKRMLGYIQRARETEKYGTEEEIVDAAFDMHLANLSN